MATVTQSGSSRPLPLTTAALARPGIYQIVCAINGKRYIGSAVNLQHRWITHRRELRMGIHGNSYLQKSWDKHGEHAFQFHVLEFVEVSDLLRVEQQWLDAAQTTDAAIGFNICPTAGSNLGRKFVGYGKAEQYQKEWHGFIDPSGQSVVIRNMARFCATHNLLRGAMYNLADPLSRTASHRGWTHESKLDRDRWYSGFVTPQGVLLPAFRGLSTFCKERGLSRKAMFDLFRGLRSEYQGWTRETHKMVRGQR